VEIRSLEDADVEAVLEINRLSIEALSPLDAESLVAHRKMAAETVVCDIDGEVAAFAIAYGPNTAYESVHYRWHSERFEDFLYLDRIVVAESFRRRGIATALYDSLEQVAVEHGRMVCEIYSIPPNVESLAFHRGRGYVEIGHLMKPDGRQVVLLEKPL
jgi:predicted GNAT superfamily acetyltransferase